MEKTPDIIQFLDELMQAAYTQFLIESYDRISILSQYERALVKSQIESPKDPT